MIAMSIQVQLEEVVNWGFASALSVILLIIVLILFFIYNRFLGLDLLWGGSQKSGTKPDESSAAIGGAEASYRYGFGSLKLNGVLLLNNFFGKPRMLSRGCAMQ